MDELDKLKESIIDRYEMALSLNGDEICKEIDSILPDDLDLMRVKAYWCCVLYTVKKNNFDTKLYEKCKKYLDHYHYYENLKNN